MNQTRTFLLFALLAVAYFLFLAWEKDYGPQPPPPEVASTGVASSTDASVPGAIPTATPSTPAPATPAQSGQNAAAPAQLITITTDVLKLSVDTRGGSLVHADLLAYPQAARTHKSPNPPPTVLLSSDEAHYSVAQSGLVSSSAVHFRFQSSQYSKIT